MVFLPRRNGSRYMRRRSSTSSVSTHTFWLIALTSSLPESTNTMLVRYSMSLLSSCLPIFMRSTLTYVGRSALTISETLRKLGRACIKQPNLLVASAELLEVSADMAFKQWLPGAYGRRMCQQ
jgi:hypothetical protein